MNGGYVIGIEGGGTNTRLAACGPEGKVFYEERGEGINLCALSGTEVQSRLSSLLQACIRQCGGRAPVSVCIGAAGVVDGDTAGRLAEFAAQAAGCDDIYVCDDGEISLYANFKDGAGLSVTAGTGSIVLGQSAGGKRFRASGWGHLFSDEGSAYDISRRAFACLCAEHDAGRGDSALLRALLAQTESATFEELISAVYLRYSEKAAFAGFARTVSACAEKGDALALRVLEEGADALFAHCKRVISRCGLQSERFGVCFNGSVLTQCGQVRERLACALSSKYDCSVQPCRPALYGALEIALGRAKQKTEGDKKS